MDEPREVIDWALAFAGMEAEIEAERVKAASEGRR